MWHGLVVYELFHQRQYPLQKRVHIGWFETDWHEYDSNGVVSLLTTSDRKQYCLHHSIISLRGYGEEALCSGNSAQAEEIVGKREETFFLLKLSFKLVSLQIHPEIAVCKT